MSELNTTDLTVAKRRDFLRMAGKAGTGAAATAVVMTAVKPTVALAAYGGGNGGGHNGGKGPSHGRIRHKLKLGDKKGKTKIRRVSRGWKVS